MYTEQEKENIKKTHLAMLAGLSMVDDKLDPIEFDFIKEVAERMGYPDQELFQIIENTKSLDISYPETLIERTNIFFSLIYLMKADEKVKAEEMEFIRKVGFKLIANPMLIDELLELYSNNEPGNIPDDMVVQIVNKYLV